MVEIGAADIFSDADGIYYHKIATGTYGIAVSYPGYVAEVHVGLAVAGGSTSTINFVLRKSQIILVEPVLAQVTSPDTDGDYIQSWTSVDNASVYQLQESDNASFDNASDIWTTDTSEAVNGKTDGTYYYRVKATRSGYTESGWRTGSNSCIVSLPTVFGGWRYFSGSGGTISFCFG